jgi:hypothetical protein
MEKVERNIIGCVWGLEKDTNIQRRLAVAKSVWFLRYSFNKKGPGALSSY